MKYGQVFISKTNKVITMEYQNETDYNEVIRLSKCNEWKTYEIKHDDFLLMTKRILKMRNAEISYIEINTVDENSFNIYNTFLNTNKLIELANRNYGYINDLFNYYQNKKIDIKSIHYRFRNNGIHSISHLITINDTGTIITDDSNYHMVTKLARTVIRHNNGYSSII